MDSGYNWLKDIIGASKTGAMLRAQAKATIKKTALEQFTVVGVILLLASIDPESVTRVADMAFSDTRNKALKDLTDTSLLDDAEFEAMFTEARAETMATLTKIQAVAARAAQR